MKPIYYDSRVSYYPGYNQLVTVTDYYKKSTNLIGVIGGGLLGGAIGGPVGAIGGGVLGSLL